MARPRGPRRGRVEARLDPVRWHRPGRGTLLRLAAIAALLITAALITWSGPETCASPATEADGPPTRGSAGAESDSASVSSVDSSGQAPGSDTAGRAIVPIGTVGVPVRLAEPTALTLVRPGDHVDLLRVGDNNPATNAVAAAALVLGVTGADDPTTGGLLLALTPAEAARAVTDPGRGFAVLIRP